MKGAPSPILTAARDYIKDGWAVFPVPPGTKRSYEKAEDNEGRRWGASSDPDTVERLFRKWPNAGIGIACQESGMVVLDLDRKDGKDGVQWMLDRIAEHCPLPNTIEVQTPSGGWHIYFKTPFDFDPKTCEGEIAPGVDVRGHGGFVVAPPTRKPDAGVYCWKNPPGFFEPAALPQWLADLLPRRSTFKPDTGFSFDAHERASISEVSDILSHIDPDAGGYDQWVRVLMALHDHFGGSQEGLTIAETWSSCGAKYKHGEVAAKWKTFKPGSGVTFGSVCELARQNGADLSETARRHRLKADWGETRSKTRDDTSTAQEEASAPFFRQVTEWAGKTPPEREWHVPELIPARQVTALYGDGGNGKSLLAMQLAMATAAGRAWIGRPVERHGVAFYLSAEDDDAELHRRFAAIAEAEELDLSGMPLFRRSLAGEESLLATFDRHGTLIRTPLQDTIEDAIAQAKPSLLVLDTLADLHSGNEIERTVARQFIGLQRGVAVRHGCAIMLLAHPSLSGMASGSGSSGSTAWSNSVRSRLYLERISDGGNEPDPDARRLSSRKMNYGRAGTEIALRWKAGRFVEEAAPDGLDALAARAKAERVFLKLLAEFNAEGRRVRHTTGDGFAPNAFAKSGRAEGLSKSQLKTAMESLFAAGRIRVGEDGPPSRRTKHIEEVPK